MVTRSVTRALLELALVERLARRFSWGISIAPLEPRGMRVRLTWRR
ncbi:hypothetical protein JQX13_38615 [Archangium violaceum]|nr:hypothetical protein [Archangium violaceum]QRK06000.1 hypothetical protein JQX13_38615 [Archangium violaceum]